MSVENTTAFTAELTANGVTTVFPWSFYAASADEIAVYRNGAVITTGFTVSRAADGTGSVTFAAAPANGTKIRIVSDPDFTQEVEFQQFGPFRPSDINAPLDRAAARDIWLKAQAASALRVQPWETSLPVEIGANPDGKVLTVLTEGGVRKIRPVTNSVAGAEQSAISAAEDAAATAADRLVVAADKAIVAGYKTAAQEQAAIATLQAGIATAAFDASKVKLWASATTPPSGVASGEYYWVVDAARENLLLYVNTSGTGEAVSPAVSAPLTPELQDAIAQFNASVGRVEPILDSLLGYTGSGPIIPIVVDGFGRNVIFGYDTDARKLVGLGLGGSGTAVTAPVLDDLPVALTWRTWNANIAQGQSNGAGAGGQPAISLTQPYANRTWPGGPRLGDFDTTTTKLLVEDNLDGAGGSGRGETLCSGAANIVGSLYALEDGGDPEDHIIFTWTAALGGATLAEIEKGSSQYNGVFLPQINAAVARAPGGDLAIHTISVVHGEQDAFNELSRADYKTGLIQWRADIEADVQARTGQTTPVHMLISQCSWRVQEYAEIALAQYEAAQEDEFIHLVNPTYHLDYDASDSVHYVNTAHKLNGGAFGVFYKRLVIDGKIPRPFVAKGAYVRGNTVVVTFDVPYPPLVLDASTIPLTEDFGFVVTDDAAPVAISKVEAGADRVTITLADAPTGDVVVRYALDNLAPGMNIGTTTGNPGASGNLRDSSPETIMIEGVEQRIYRWCPAFPPITAIPLGE